MLNSQRWVSHKLTTQRETVSDQVDSDGSWGHAGYMFYYYRPTEQYIMRSSDGV